MAKRPDLTEREKKIMLDAYQKGMTSIEASALVGATSGCCLHWLRRRGIPVRDRSSCERIHTLDERYFSNIDTEEKAYWLGFITADGCISSRGHVLSIGLSAVDRSHLPKLKSALKSTAPIREFTIHTEGYRTRHICQFSVSSMRMKADLVALGVGPKKSHTSSPWTGSDHLMAAYWRGAFDGDGSIYKTIRKATWSNGSDVYTSDHWSIEFCGSMDMVQGFATFIADIIGIVKRPSPISSIFRVRYGGIDLPQQITRALYQDAIIFLDRKKLLADEILAIVPKQKYLRSITSDELASLFVKHQRWDAVCAELGCEMSGLRALRKRLGVYRDGRKRSRTCPQ